MADGTEDWKPGRAEWLALMVLVIPAFAVGVDFTLLHLAVPELSEDLEPSSSGLLWIVDSYGFMVAGFLITMGTLGDRVGRRKLLMIGMTGFIVVSALASFAESTGTLIAARAALGVCGATVAPSTMALIRTIFITDHYRLVAISIWAVGWFGGVALGPVLSGFAIEVASWQAVFLIPIPLLLPLLFVAPRWLPEYKDADAGSIDLISVALSIVAVVGVIYGLKHAAEDGVDGVTIGTVLVGTAMLALFVRRQLTLSSPLLDVAMFRNRKVTAALSTQTIAVIALGGTQFFIAQYLQLVLGYSALETGAWLVLPTLIGISTTFAGPSLAQKYRPSSVIAAGMVITAIGLGTFVALVEVESLWLALGGYMLTWAGLGPMFALCADLIIGAAPEEKAGSAGALSETFNEAGFALGVGALATAGIAVYRRQLEVPEGVPADAGATAVDSLGGAVGVAEGLPAATGDRLLESGHEAFSHGLALCGGVGAVMCLVGAVWIAMALRSHDFSGPADAAGLDPAPAR